MGIIPKFTGWLMPDFLPSYLAFDNCMHTFCKSHLMRELIFLFEQHQQPWAEDLHDLFMDMLQSVKDLKARDAPLTEKDFTDWQQRYRKILRTGREANPLTPEQRANKAQTIQRTEPAGSLRGYEDCILAFLWEMDLPFTNNEAERAFRMMKVRLKISGCFRTLAVLGAMRESAAIFPLCANTDCRSSNTSVIRSMVAHSYLREQKPPE